MLEVVVIAHNIRSTHNVGSILRTSDGFGVSMVYCTGYTPYPTVPGDRRLPHEREKLTAQIHKAALGAESIVPVAHKADILKLILTLKNDGYLVVALEQAPGSVMLPDFQPDGGKIALLLGEEVHGTPPELLEICDTIVEIPMRGQKESFNVSVAAGIALYQITLA